MIKTIIKYNFKKLINTSSHRSVMKTFFDYIFYRRLHHHRCADAERTMKKHQVFHGKHQKMKKNLGQTEN